MKYILHHAPSEHENGFTLVELIIVVVMIGLLSVVGGTSFVSSIASSRDARRKTDMESIRTALESFRSDNSSYPVSLPTLEAPTKKYITLPKDPKTNDDYYYDPQSITTVGGVHYYGSYIVGTLLEKPSAQPTCGAQITIAQGKCKDSSNTNVKCNYCRDPYGTQ